MTRRSQERVKRDAVAKTIAKNHPDLVNFSSAEVKNILLAMFPGVGITALFKRISEMNTTERLQLAQIISRQLTPPGG